MDQSGNDFSVSRIHREVCTDSFSERLDETTVCRFRKMSFFLK